MHFAQNRLFSRQATWLPTDSLFNDAVSRSRCVHRRVRERIERSELEIYIKEFHWLSLRYYCSSSLDYYAQRSLEAPQGLTEELNSTHINIQFVLNWFLISPNFPQVKTI
jgi:hypothetical protein